MLKIKMVVIHKFESDLDLDNQPGPSGINAIDRDRPGPIGLPRIIVEEFGENGKKIHSQSDAEVAGDALGNVSKKKVEVSPYKHFSEMVTITGLREAYDEKPKAVRITFRIALICCFAIMIYLAIRISNQYQNRSTIKELTELNEPPPFPNFHICTPLILNNTMLDYMSKLDYPPSTKKLMIKHNLTTEDIKSVPQTAFLYKVGFVKTPFFVVARKVHQFMWEKIFESDLNVKNLLQPECSKMLSECAYGKNKFDCCSAARFSFGGTSTCYEIKVFNRSLEDNWADSPRLEDIGLTMDVSTNWNQAVFDEDNSASDGFYIFIDNPPTHNDVPVFVPADMNALVVLGQPKNRLETTNCLSGAIPKLEYFDSYDSRGSNCLMETGLKGLKDFLGCAMPAASYIPSNNITCNYDQMTLVKMVVFDDFIDRDSNPFTKKAHDFYKFYVSLLRGERCLPLCSRWTYPVSSVSYGSIRYRDKIEEKRQLANRSWSRIQIIVPYTRHWLEKEKTVAASYLAMCEIGGMMGVYAGFSMITFAQIIYYGARIVFSKCKKKRDRNKIHPEVVMKKTVVSKNVRETRF